MNDLDRSMNAFRGALVIAAFLAVAIVLIVGGALSNWLMGAGVGALVFVVAFVYLFGAGIGEW